MPLALLTFSARSLAFNASRQHGLFDCPDKRACLIRWHP
jgi:hypothetical protein